MAGPYYVRSTDGSDADNGLSWANAKATLAGALAVAVAGERIWVSQAHAESSASAIILTAPTSGPAVQVFCGNDAAEPPTAFATTATITTAGSANLDIRFTGYADCKGIIFNANGDIEAPNTTDACSWTFENCALNITDTNGTRRFIIGGSSTGDAYIRMINPAISFGSVNQGISLRGTLDWRGGSITGATLPTALFLLSNVANSGHARLRGVDLSVIAGTLVDVANQSHEIIIENCKLHASVTESSGTSAGIGGTNISIVNSDGADTNYRYYRRRPSTGTIRSETTIVRTGGAHNGLVTFSRKLVSTANTTFERPLYSDWVYIDNDTIGSAVSVGFEIVNDGVTLTDADAWIEVEYSGTSGFPTSSLTRDRAADILATPANQTTSSETWTTTGLTSPVKQALVASVTPQEKGPIRARMALARASTTLYLCPEPVIT